MKWDRLEDEACSVARTVSVIGDRWTLLILRDCFRRIRRFDEFQSRLGITRHLLAERLRKLVRQGVLRRVAYQERPKRYEYILTQKGLDLHPIMMSIVHWGRRAHGGRARPAGASSAQELRASLRSGDDLFGVQRTAGREGSPRPSGTRSGHVKDRAALARTAGNGLMVAMGRFSALAAPATFQ